MTADTPPIGEPPTPTHRDNATYELPGRPALTAQLLNSTPALQNLCNRMIGHEEVKNNPAPKAIPASIIKQVQRRLPVDSILELVRAYEVGATVPDLVERYGIHRTTVLAHLERQGVPRRPNRFKLTEGQLAEASQLYAKGWSLIPLGKRFGVDDGTMRKALLREGVMLRPRRGWRC